jgi:hypothetical protein
MAAAVTAAAGGSLNSEDEQVLFSNPSIPSEALVGGIAERMVRQQSGESIAAFSPEALPAAASAAASASTGMATDGMATGGVATGGMAPGLQATRSTAAARRAEALRVEAAGAFQRVVVSGSDGLSSEDDDACRYLARALRLRQKHLFKKPQQYWGSIHPDVAPHLAPSGGSGSGSLGTASEAAAASAAAASSRAGLSRSRSTTDRAIEEMRGAAQTDLDISSSQLSLNAPQLGDDELRGLLGLPGDQDVSRYRQLFHRRRPALAYNPQDIRTSSRMTELAYRWIDGVVHVFYADALAKVEGEIASSGAGAGTSAGARRRVRTAAGSPSLSPVRGGGRSQSPTRHAHVDRHPLIAAGAEPVYAPPSILEEFLADYGELCKIVHSAHVKSFSWMRLQLLEKRFDLHRLLNAQIEVDEQKTVPHRDFYNVRKVDTHVHHSACMNQKHLLRFIKHKLRFNPDEVSRRDSARGSGAFCCYFRNESSDRFVPVACCRRSSLRPRLVSRRPWQRCLRS